MNRSSRRFPAAALTLGALLLGGACTPGDAREGSAPLRVAYVLPEGDRWNGAARGAELGAEEARRAGDLVGRGFEVSTARASGPEAAVRAASRLLRGGAFAIVGAGDGRTCTALAALAEREDVLFLNAGCREDALRELPGARAFHVEASETMYREAAPGGGDPVLWHGGLSRYGAAQLNDRFERRFGAAADGPAWASWMAIKILWEAAYRTGSTDPARLATYMVEEGRFDGHKGEPLSFGARDRQLRQPLYGAGAAGPVVGPDENDGEAAVLSGTIPAEGPLVLVTNEGSRDVAIIDATTHAAVSRIRVGSRPRGIRVSPDGRRAYVALSDDRPTEESDRDAIAVLDVRAGKVLARLPAGTDPEQFALSPDGGTLYAANEDAGTASVTDLEDGKVRATLVVGIEPEGVAVSPDGRWVYVTAETSNTVSVIDTRAGEVVASFMVDVRPRDAAFAPNGRRAYVTNEITGTVSVVDVAEHRVVSTIGLGGKAKPVGVAVSPDGARVYVATGHGGTLAVIDAGTERIVAQVRVGRRPWGVALSPDGRWAYTANGPSDDVSVVDTRTLRTVATVPTGRLPWGVAVTP